MNRREAFDKLAVERLRMLRDLRLLFGWWDEYGQHLQGCRLAPCDCGFESADRLTRQMQRDLESGASTEG